MRVEDDRLAEPADILALRSIAELYAQAMDRNRPELLDRILTSDAVLEGPGFRLVGIAEIRQAPATLQQRFRAVRHLVHNQPLRIDRERAEGETYATAFHLSDKEDGTPEVLLWHIRYQDRFRCEQGQWKLAHRVVVLDWTETRLPGAAAFP